MSCPSHAFYLVIILLQRSFGSSSPPKVRDKPTRLINDSELSPKRGLSGKLSRVSERDHLVDPGEPLAESSPTSLDCGARASDPRVQQRISKLEEFEKNFSIVLRTMTDAMRKSEERISASEKRDYIKREWQQVALVVDRLLLVIFVLLTVGVTLGLLLRGTIKYML